MNSYQELWWKQAQSDHAVLLLLRHHGAIPCQQLHYLQMVTEKIAKAHFWRSGHPPPKSHAGFVQFLRYLGASKLSARRHVARTFGFDRFRDFQNWLRLVVPLAYSLERLAPALALENGPNPEYPWPRNAPENAPATFDFDLWPQLTATGRGRQLLQVIDLAVERFPSYA